MEMETQEENYLTHKDMDLVVDLQRIKGDSCLGADAELQDGELTDEERFLEEFPSWKQKQEEDIRKLYALAEDIDTHHKKYTKTRVVAYFTAVVSEVMSLVGLALAPTTAGGSLMLTAASQVLEAVTQVTNAVTHVRENSRNKRAQAQANRIAPMGDRELESMGGEKTSYVTATGEIVYKCGSAYEIVGKNIHALRQARKHPHVTSAAKRLMTTGQVSARSSRQVQKAFGGTVLEMTKRARVLGVATSAFSLSQDLVHLCNDWKQLKDGKEAELAKQMRRQARELQKVVSERTHHYHRLKQKKLAGERLGNSSLDKAMKTQPQPPATARKAKSQGQQAPLRATKGDQGRGSRLGRLINLSFLGNLRRQFS